MSLYILYSLDRLSLFWLTYNSIHWWCRNGSRRDHCLILVRFHLFMKSQWVRLLWDINDTVFFLLWLHFLNVVWLVNGFHRAYLCYLNDKNFHQDQILILLKSYSPNNNNTDYTRLVQCIYVWLMPQYYFLQNQCKN